MSLNLVAISQEVTANSGDGGDVPTCQPCNNTGVGEIIFTCKGCDTACGRVSYFGTADVFAGFRSEPAFSQQEPDEQRCSRPLGECTECKNSPGQFSCGCAYIDNYDSMSYARFSNKQFISIKENGVYKNRKMTEGEYLEYINRGLRVNITQNQSHEMNCPGFAAPNCGGDTTAPLGGSNINGSSCISSSSRGNFPCRLVISGEGDSTSYNFDTKTFFNVGPLWQTTFSNGLNSVFASYDLPWIQSLNEYPFYSWKMAIPPVTPLAENKEDTLFNYLKCANQNYLFGNKNNVPDGVTAVFIADYINETFTPELCDLVDSCSLGGAAGCESFNLANCKKEMDSLCFNRAERYGIIKGCTSASGFTLGHVRYESKNRDDFVFFFQGINTGNRNTLSPIGSTPEGAEEIVSFGITYNDCFGYYSVEFEGQSVCKRPGLMADPMYFSDAFSIDEVYLPTDTDTCDVLLGSRLINLYPPQHSGTCYMIDTAGNNITANDQFETISYFSKNSPFRATIFNNFIYPITKNLSENGISTYGSTDFLNKALCTYFMPRHPYYSQTIGEALPFYAYGYKPAPGFEGTIDINLCPRYDFYKSENEKKSIDPDYTIVPGHGDAFYSLMGELYCTNYGPIDDPGTGGGAGGGAGFVDDSICGNEPQFGEAACFFNVGIQNPLTPWPPTQEERLNNLCEYSKNAYGVKIYGHSRNDFLPDNNVTKYFNACFPCRGFIDLPPDGHETAVFTEYEDIEGGIKRIIVKSYTREGNYTNHSVGSILARMTLKEQINQGNIYYTDAAYFTLSLIGSGIETLHTREITKKEYYDTVGSNGVYAKWDTVPNAAPTPSDYRARKLLLMQGLHPTHGETLNNIIDQSKVFFTNEYKNPMDPIFAKNFAYENGGYIGVNGQFVADYVFGQAEAGVPSEKYYNEIGNPNKVHGLFDLNNQINGAFDKSTSDRNPKVNNVTGILRVHKEYEIEPGRTIPVCREKFETKNGNLTNCDLPNNLVMNGLCWITTVLHSDIWEDAPKNWAEEMDLQFGIPPEPGQPPNVIDYTSFETWLDSTTVPSNILDNNFIGFIQSVGNAINNAKQNNPDKYIGTGQMDSVPTPITEELYLNRKVNGAYVYNFDDFRKAAEKSTVNDYSCYNPDSITVNYSCQETFNCSENEDLGQTYCEFNSTSLSTLEQLEATMIAAANSFFVCNEFIQGGKFTNIPTSPCMTSMIGDFNNDTNANLFGSCGLTESKATDLIQLMLDSRANPCIFQYNNKIYRVME